MLFSLKGIKAYRHAVKQVKTGGELPIAQDEETQVEYICAHYTMLGLSFIIKLKDGRVIQKKIYPTLPAIAEMFSSLGG